MIRIAASSKLGEVFVQNLAAGALSAEHVLNVVARLNAKPVPDSVETTLALKEPPLANTQRYDSLRELGADAQAVQVAQSQEVSHAL